MSRSWGALRVVAPSAAPPAPACWPSQGDWLRYLGLFQPGERVRQCRYCLPEFAERMRAEGRCDRPGVVFVEDPEEGTIGLEPDEMPAKK